MSPICTPCDIRIRGVNSFITMLLTAKFFEKKFIENANIRFILINVLYLNHFEQAFVIKRTQKLNIFLSPSLSLLLSLCIWEGKP